MRNWLLAIVGAAFLAAVPLYETFQWTVNYYYVPEGKSLLLRYKGPLIFTWGNTKAATGHFAGEGEIGVKEMMPGPGRHFYCPIWWERTLVDDVVVQPGQLAVVTSKMGADLPAGQFLLDGDLGQTTSRGILRRTFGPGRYRINPYAYDVKVVENAQTEAGKCSGWVHVNPGYVGVMTYLTDNPAVHRKAGIQNDTLPPGLYPINPHEIQVDLVSIGYNAKELSTEKLKDEGGHVLVDESGEEQPVPDTGIGFPSADGFKIYMDFSAVWGIMPRQMREHLPQQRLEARRGRVADRRQPPEVPRGRRFRVQADPDRKGHQPALRPGPAHLYSERSPGADPEGLRGRRTGADAQPGDDHGQDGGPAPRGRAESAPRSRPHHRKHQEVDRRGEGQRPEGRRDDRG
jgi:hypothetical protein